MNELSNLLWTTPTVNAEWHRAFAAWCEEAPDWMNQAASLIEQEYARNTMAHDGYSRVGCFMMEQGAFEEALIWFEKDVAQQRASWWQQLRCAECLGALKRLPQAVDLIERVYAKYPEARNGFAMLGIRLQRADLVRRDVDECRLTPGYALNVAVLFSQSGAQEEAFALITQSYAADPSLHDGFVRVARPWLEARDFVKALAGYRLEAEADRMSAVHRLTYADLLARAGEWNAAEAEVERGYREDSRLHNGFARLGNICLLENRDSEALEWYRRDAVADRLVASHRLIYADLLARAGAWDAAEAEVSRAYQENVALCDGFARLGRLRLAEKKYDEALVFCRRDLDAARLTPPFEMICAELLARAGEWTAARKLAEKAYARDASLKNVFSRLLPWRPDEDGLSGLLSLCLPDLAPGRSTVNGLKQMALQIRSEATKQAEVAIALEQGAVDFDLTAQYQALQRAAKAEKSGGGLMPVLNAELYVACARDALIQFREIVLAQSYHFERGPSAPVIIDGGANIGMAIGYFKWLYPDARIIAFEPHPGVRELCRESVKHNHWSDTEVYPYALLDQDDEVTFNMLDAMPMGSGVTGRLTESQAAGTVRQVRIPCRRLSSFINGPVDFLKLDIEGAETRVIRELGDSLSLVRRGFIEYHYGVESDANRLSELLALLEAAGFRYRLADPPAAATSMPTPGTCLAFDKPWSCSIFFQRDETPKGPLNDKRS
ncbi:MAG: protein arginine N-methyltransferase [Kiritimatiellae bacterium]|nr:protein arginine N-methyltransferase [Kiritimatiellia bacterium]